MEDGLHLRGAEAESRRADRGRNRLQCSAGGDDDRRKRHQRQDQAADQRSRARQAHEVDEDRQTQETINDGGDGREVVDVHLDQVGELVLRREFLEIDRGRDADRQ
ncbi:hypothetical protein D3C86_1946740 [compost metagenome]